MQAMNFLKMFRNLQRKKPNTLLITVACRISVMSEDPGAFGGINQKRVAAYQSANGKALMPVRQATQNNDLSWTVVAAASPAWAERVFPDLKGEAAVDRLWEEIFKTTRIDREDPIQAWKITILNCTKKKTG